MNTLETIFLLRSLWQVRYEHIGNNIFTKKSGRSGMNTLETIFLVRSLGQVRYEHIGNNIFTKKSVAGQV